MKSLALLLIDDTILVAFNPVCKIKLQVLIPKSYHSKWTMNAPQTVIYNRLLAKVRFKHIQAVVLTAELGSTHKAAEVAGISQPSVAKFLSAVEALIDEPLFERHARGMRPTPACNALLPFFQATLKLLQHGAEALHAVQSGAAGSVHIGALPAACGSQLMSGLAQFSERYPQFRLHLEENSLALLNEHLEGGVYDAVFVRTPTPLHAGYQFDILQDDQSIVLARKGHRLMGKRALSLRDLAVEKWLVLPVGTTSRSIFESWFSTASLYPKIVNVSTSNLSALATLVAQSDALIVLPRSFAAPALAAGQVCALDVERQDPLSPLGILWHPGSASVATAMFCHWMIEGN